MSQIDSKQMEQPIGEVTPIDRHRAARHVASQAHDATDAHDLLEALGLMGDLEFPDDAA